MESIWRSVRDVPTTNAVVVISGISESDAFDIFDSSMVSDITSYIHKACWDLTIKCQFVNIVSILYNDNVYIITYICMNKREENTVDICFV